VVARPKKKPVATATAAERARLALDSALPKPTSDIPLTRRELALVEQARPPPTVRVLTQAELCAKLGVSYPSIWRWMQTQGFPRPVELSPGMKGRVGWIEHEVDAWIYSRPRRILKGDDDATAR
jgi:prophage regulatory protein